MDDSPSSPQSTSNLPTRDRIVQRLSGLGIPEENWKQPRLDLVPHLDLDELVSTILPSDKEVFEAILEGQEESSESLLNSSIEDIYHESMIWLRWLMFEGDSTAALEELSEMNGQRGVCGAVWGNNDIAYRCRTCEHDPTCAICVPCFLKGNHKDHDYSIIYTGGGCCDCGDVTAWKREGFCSEHRGAEQIQPLPEKFSRSMGPVLDSLLRFWKKKLLLAESISQECNQADDRAVKMKTLADELTSSVVEMLLEFCKHSESLLSFISKRVFSAVGLLDILVRAERMLNDDVVRKLHELLLKFLGEPQFKYELAKVFLIYYPTIVKDAVKENSDLVFKKFALLSTFSVQILTVPTLTPRLVKEMNLLSILFDCLGDIFSSCAGDDNKLQVSKWGNLYETTIRVVEDIRFVMSHSEVPKYVTHERRDILRSWMRLLSFVQGMNPQKRATGHVEEENDQMHIPFVLCHSLANIHSLLVVGAFADSVNEETQDEAMIMCEQDFEDQDSVRHSKVGRLSEESSVCSVTGWNASDHAAKASEMKCSSNPLPPSVVWLTFECMKALENWLRVDNTSRALVDVFSPKMSYSTGNNLLTLRRTLSKFRKEGCRSHDQDAASDDCRPDGKQTTELEALRFLSFSDWPEIAFDVSSQEFSVHIPLHRLLSIILQRAFKMCYGESPKSTTSSSYSADPLPASGCHDFFGQILGGYHPHGFSAFLMEHPLRLRVFCAEVHAGMWRRNGDVAIISSEWYRSVRWSEQGLEFDLFLLQCCAALAPADLYVQRLLERFGLSKYLSLNIERSSEYEPILVQEMITLIIQIIKERRFSGFSTAECLRRELVYKLSMGNSPRSQLVKSLPRDLSKVEKLQEILDDIADYSNPSGVNQGTYKIKTQYWKELDLYHPRWNPRDLQNAEERFLRFCNCSALTNQLPKWSKIYYPLRGVARIATCKMTAQIVHAVLFYAVFTDKSTASRAPDGVLIAALHLLSLALDVCYVQKKSDDHLFDVDDVIPVLAFAGEERGTNRHAADHSMLSLLVHLLRIHQKQNVNTLREDSSYNLSSLIENMLKMFAELDSKCRVKLQSLAPDVVSQLVEGERSRTPFKSDADKHKEKARERQAAMLEKMKAQQSKFLASIDSSLDDDMDMDDKEVQNETTSLDIGNSPEESIQVICSLCHDMNSTSPVSYLVLLQKSRLLSFVDRASPTWDQGYRSGKELASTSSNMIEISPRGRNTSQCSEAFSSKMFQLIQHAVNQFAAEGHEMKAIMEYIKARFPALNVLMPHTDANSEAKTAPSVESFEEDIHRMVREEMRNCLSSANKLPYIGDSEVVDPDTDALFLAKYIAALAKETLDNASGSDNSDGSSQSEGNRLPPVLDGTGPDDCDGIYLTSCGHAVHQECLDRYLWTLKERHTRRIVFEGGNVVDPDQGEFLCPVCRGLSNSVLPASSLKSDSVPVTIQLDAVGFPSFSKCGSKSLQLQEALCLLQSAAKVAGSSEIVRSFPVQCPGKIKLNLDPVCKALGGMYVSGKDKLSESSRLGESPLMLWDTLKYSLISTELASRSRKSSLAPDYSLTALYNDLKSSNSFILSLLLDIVQKVRTTNPLSSLLRLKGIQSFAQSICSSVPLDKIHEPSPGRRGYVQEILEKCGSESQCREIRLWRRASDPIIARDPFSSFMWTLFCLPSTFMISEESFLCLVHMFYVVTITQAAITYIHKRGWGTTEVGYRDCLFADIYKFMEEYEVGMEYFQSNYIDSFKDMKDSIRRLSFPYLRKCALLWKLINSSQAAPFSDGAQGSVELTYMGDDSTEFTNNAGEELVEIEKLENMFKIPPLDVVSEDGLLRSVVGGWLHHFSKELEAHCLPRTLYLTPVVPLRLMHLPRLYQDILQRYIKQRCPECGTVPDDPALCLVCGKLCSSMWKTCCRESVCQTHALSCGAGTGVFLLIRKTNVLLQRSGKQATWPSPYLDLFGEEDFEMNRGKPLYLNEERYAALTHMVASHGLERSSRVLRQTPVGGFFIL